MPVNQTAITEGLQWSPSSTKTYTENFWYNSAVAASTFSNPWDSIQTSYSSVGYELGQARGDTGATTWQLASHDPADSLTSVTFGATPTAITQNFTYDHNTERMTAISAAVIGGTLSVNYTYNFLGNFVLRNSSSMLSRSTPITEYYS